MRTDELRERYLRFFKDRGHQVCPSDSLVPANDPTLLFTGAGMNQFKDYFLGKGKLPFRRATSSQKCIRTGDLDRVGKTAAHHTFFEMLGNFSFGDYFKREAIQWAWEFLLQELKMSPDRLYPSVYVEDPEAFDIWSREIGVAPSRISRFGAADNFWPANAPTDGPNGPCGPCSEIYFDRGPEHGCGKPGCAVGCSCSRFVEIWNLVFTQFDRRDGGKLEPLPQKNIDTGMGLERLASVMQGTPNNMEIDIFQPLLRGVVDTCGRPYVSRSEDGARMRRIVDHIRGVTFMIADGVVPDKEGRGYVLRKVLRRAERDGMVLGIDEPYLYKLVPVVAQVMAPAYPELLPRVETIARQVRGEEEGCRRVYEDGTARLKHYVAAHKARAETVVTGQEVFFLHDTLGYMVEWVEAILGEQGMTFDRAGFDHELEAQRRRARAGSKMKGDIFASGPVAKLKDRTDPTVFVGYDQLESEAKVVGIILQGELVERVTTGQEAILVLDRTPCYGESGGQIGDTGRMIAADAEFEVRDTQKQDGYHLHQGVVTRGEIAVGRVLNVAVEPGRRGAIVRAHTATHILQWALRGALGTHVEQAGSLVAPDRLRFDFSHFSSVTREELQKIEDLVNERVTSDLPVKWTSTTLDEARKLGALMFFGEKYGDVVRVVDVGGFSKELCGGTHAQRTGQIGYFRIAAEASVAAGTRRIEAVTGQAAVTEAFEAQSLLHGLAGTLGVPADKLPERLQGLMHEIRTLKQELHKLKAGAAAGAADDFFDASPVVQGVRVIAHRIDDKTPDELRVVSDHVRKKGEPFALFLASAKDGKVSLVTCLHENVVEKGLDAVALIRVAAKPVQGGGGGRKDLAQAGGKDPAGIAEALKIFTREASAKLGG